MCVVTVRAGFHFACPYSILVCPDVLFAHSRGIRFMRKQHTTFGKSNRFHFPALGDSNKCFQNNRERRVSLFFLSLFPCALRYCLTEFSKRIKWRKVWPHFMNLFWQNFKLWLTLSKIVHFCTNTFNPKRESIKWNFFLVIYQRKKDRYESKVDKNLNYILSSGGRLKWF